MGCEEIEKLLLDYASGDISAAQRQIVEEHLSRCARCREALAAYNEARQYLTSLEDTPVPQGFTEATKKKVRAATTKRRMQRRLRLALGAVAAVIIIAMLMITQPWGLSPQSVMARAYAATEGLQSYRATITGTASDGRILDSIMEFVSPDRFHARITSDGVTDEFTLIGDKQYVKSGDMSRNMIIVFARSASSILSKENTMQILDSLTDLQKLPDEKIEGINCYHYKGRFDTEKMFEKENARLSQMQSSLSPEDYQEMLKGLENLLNVKMEFELWIGKDDNLVRKMIQVTQAPDSEGQLHTSSTILKYYDFNQPINIEPPLDAEGKLLPGWELSDSRPVETHFDTEINYEILGEDPANQKIDLSVTITNVGLEAASNVRVELRNSAVMGDTGEASWINAEPLTSERVNLKAGESAIYSASWECDASYIAKEKFTDLINKTIIRIIYTTPDGYESVRLYSEDAPYPTAVPPEGPPD
jgi:hypothetical protein